MLREDHTLTDFSTLNDKPITQCIYTFRSTYLCDSDSWDTPSLIGQGVVETNPTNTGIWSDGSLGTSEIRMSGPVGTNNSCLSIQLPQSLPQDYATNCKEYVTGSNSIGRAGQSCCNLPSSGTPAAGAVVCPEELFDTVFVDFAQGVVDAPVGETRTNTINMIGSTGQMTDRLRAVGNESLIGAVTNTLSTGTPYTIPVGVSSVKMFVDACFLQTGGWVNPISGQGTDYVFSYSYGFWKTKPKPSVTNKLPNKIFQVNQLPPLPNPISSIKIFNLNNILDPGQTIQDLLNGDFSGKVRVGTSDAGDFSVDSNGFVTFTYSSPSLSPKAVFGTVDTSTGIMTLSFDSPVSSTQEAFLEVDGTNESVVSENNQTIDNVREFNLENILDAGDTVENLVSRGFSGKIYSSATEIGNFSVSSNGSVSFTPASATSSPKLVFGSINTSNGIMTLYFDSEVIEDITLQIKDSEECSTTIVNNLPLDTEVTIELENCAESATITSSSSQTPYSDVSSASVTQNGRSYILPIVSGLTNSLIIATTDNQPPNVSGSNVVSIGGAVGAQSVVNINYQFRNSDNIPVIYPGSTLSSSYSINNNLLTINNMSLNTTYALWSSNTTADNSSVGVLDPARSWTRINTLPDNDIVVSTSVGGSSSTPSAPKFLTITSGPNSIGLGWYAPDSSGDSPITNYRVSYSEDGIQWTDVTVTP